MSKKHTTEEFIEKAKKIHGDKYDYSKTKYGKDNKDKVLIIHKKCGKEFLQSPFAHTKNNHPSGCPYCSHKNKAYSWSEWLKLAHKIHSKENYEYPKDFDYKNCKQKIPIICHKIDEVTGKKHGLFEMRGRDFLNSKQSCPKCSKPSKKYTTEEWLKLVKIKRKNFEEFDYTFVNYTGNKNKVMIIHKKCGRIFEQVPHYHYNSLSGCPYCKESKLEIDINEFLKKNNIKFLKYYRIDWLRNPETNYPLELDFYLPEYNIAIECQGRQHFEPIKWFGDKIGLEKQIILNLIYVKNIILIFFIIQMLENQ